MTPEQLLVPRYKVLIEYPHSHFKVGDVLEWTESSMYQGHKMQIKAYAKFINETTGHAWVDFPEHYPQCFQKLQWYEDRKIEDLPQYIKIDDVVYKVDKWEYFLGVLPRAKSDKEKGRKNHFLSVDWHFGRKKSVPATEKEYIDYINSI